MVDLLANRGLAYCYHLHTNQTFGEELMKPTLLETFEGEFKLIVNLGKGICVLTFENIHDLKSFVEEWHLDIEILLDRREVPESAVISYIPPLEWTEEMGYNFNWWRV